MLEADRRLTDDLYAIGAIKFGEFRLKSGVISPFYIDLRGLISHPRVLRAVANRLLAVLSSLRFDRIAGIPYAGLPIATAVGLVGDIPAIYPRKEVKDHGTRRMIKGDFAPGETVVPIDDVISDGASKMESAEPLLEAKLVVRDFVVLLDRETGGAERLKEKGYELHSVLRVKEVLAYLQNIGQLETEMHTRCLDFLAEICKRA